MNDNLSHPIIGKLRQAGRVHARHRGLMLFARTLKWIVLAIPVWMIADVLFHFPESLRLTGLVVILLALAGLAVASGAIAAFFRPPVLRIARLLESRDPALGSRLVNFLQLESDTRSPQASEMTRALAAHAVERAGASLDATTLPQLAREPDLPRQTRRAIYAPAALAILTLFGGTAVRNEWLRLTDPFGDHPPFSLTRLTILDPKENATVHYGGTTLVQVRARGHIPRELFLTATAPDQSAPALTLPMIARGDGTFAVPLSGVRHALDLVAHTGNQASRSHRRHLGVILTPQIGSAMVRLSPPAYTGQAPRELPFRFNGVQALEGTALTFQIQSNRPLGAGKMTLVTGPDQTVEVTLEPGPEPPAQTAGATLIAQTSGKLSFALVDIAGNAASVVPTSTLTVTRDQPPAIAITIPEKDAFIVETTKLPLTIHASDDYGLRSVRPHVVINGTPAPIESTDFAGPDTRRHQLVHTLDLGQAGAKAGDEISLFAEAIDTRPDPQITRSEIRRMKVITEAEYNDFLRRQADVAMIAGKYEDLHERFSQLVEAQRRIEQQRRELLEKAGKNPTDESIAKELAETVREQEALNEDLAKMAGEMEGFGRENPVYDFEKDLQTQLRQQAKTLRESIAKNREANGEAARAPENQQLQPLADAAREHRERLEGGTRAMDQEVIQPLADLSKLHELIKDFNLFKELTDKQKDLAEQTGAYAAKPELTAGDRLALRALGEQQRNQARQLESLAEKLRHDAAQAKEQFPKAAASAEGVAGQIEAQGMPGLARGAAQRMLGADAASSHPPAQQLFEKMNSLFCDACQPGQQGAQEGLDRRLSLTRGMRPGNSFQQMMQSLNYRPSPSSGGSGAGSAGMMATGAVGGIPQVIGGESMMSGPISQALAGRGDRGGAGVSGAPTAKLDRPDASKPEQDSSRRTNTPGGGSILLEYENIADAYFRRLTSPP